MRPVRSTFAITVILAGAAPSVTAYAQPSESSVRPEAISAPQPAERFDSDFVLVDPRFTLKPPKDDEVRLSLHGETQFRYRALTDLSLTPPAQDPAPGSDTLGQNQYFYHWWRLNPRMDYRDKLSFVGQIDILRGLIAGDTTQLVTADRDPLDDDEWYEVHPRKLYIEYRSSIGLFRIGQQTSSWGMGILANDGDQPSMFGDYQRGSLVERFLFATTPMGEGTPLAVALAGDLVYEDNTADLIDDGDKALQGVLAVQYRTPPATLGVYGVIRHQERDGEATNELTPFTEELTVGVFDVAGEFNARAPGADAYVFGAFEAATIVGETSYVRTRFSQLLDPTSGRPKEQILSFGAAAKLGMVHVTEDDGEQYGDFVGEVEWGYASGDANPTDGDSHRFTFDANHNVGLVLFDHVLRWKTARSATLASDPALVARAPGGIQFLPSEGGVFGASYLNPRVLVRPRHWLDLKLGAVFAQATSDVVDLYRFGALGNFENYEGGDETLRDLGVELDAGLDLRLEASRTLLVQVGAEGGVLFPGGAFEDATGERLENQYLANLKLGVQY